MNEPYPVGLATHDIPKVFFTCYPNPGSGTVNFEISNPNQIVYKDLTITTTEGKKIKCIELNSNNPLITVKAELHVLKLKPGLYLAELRSNKGSTRLKFILLSE